VTVAIFFFLWSWNSFTWPLILIQDREGYTIQMGIYQYRDQYETDFAKQIAALANHLARTFNVREGLTAADDTLPERLFQPLESGAFAGVAIPRDEFQEAVALYYQMRGWNSNGCPTAARLHLLNLGWVVPLLHADHD
jgi:hypothetical protein